MTNEEAKSRIAKHNEVHQRKEPFAVYITEALYLAVAALDKQIPKPPEMKADEGFAPEVASSLCCPTCGGSVTNYWVPGAKPKHCQFCGQAIDWREEGNT